MGLVNEYNYHDLSSGVCSFDRNRARNVGNNNT